MQLRAIATCLVALSVVGCSGDDTAVGVSDGGADATLDASTKDAHADAVADAVADAAAETAADADAAGAADATADALADAAADAQPDAGPQGLGCGAAGYPQGPYGTTVGSVIANLALDGLVDANANGNVADDPPLTICLGRYHADPNVKVLVIHWTAAWCAPCATEEPSWVQLAASNAGKAVFLEAMADNVAGGPASITTIQGWANKYKVANDLAIDPSHALAPYFDVPDGSVAFPSHLVVRTDTMTIVRSDYGGTPDAGTVQEEIDAIVASLDAGSD